MQVPTTIDDRSATGPATVTPSASPTTRRLLGHAAALWLVLLAAMPLVGIDRAPLNPDGGALTLLAELVDERGAWSTPYPLSDVDPDGEFVPLGRGRYADGEMVPYASRPAYVALHSVLVGIGGIWLAIGVAGLGIAVTSLFTGLTARLVDSRAALPALWLCGIGTPLLFHAYVLQGHPYGVAAVAAAVYLGSRSWMAGWHAKLGPAAAVGTLIAIGCLIRRETVFLAAGIALWSLWRAMRHHDRSDLALGVGAGLGAVLGTGIERLLMSWAYGTLEAPNAPVLGGDGPSLLVGRVLATRHSLLLPSFDDTAILNLTALAGLVLVLVGAALLRGRQHPWTLVVGLALASGSAALRLAIDTEVVAMIPGLLLAAPVLVAGLFLVPPSAGEHRAVPFLAISSTVIAFSVLATQYESGWNWGGRFFSTLLPLVAVLSALGWTDALARLSSARARLVGAAACGSVLVIAAVGVGVQRDARSSAESLIEAVTSEVDGDTVIATSQAWLPRFDTGQLDDVDYAWARAPIERLPELLGRLDRRSGTDRVLVVISPDDEVPPFSADSEWTASGPNELPQIRTELDLWVLQRER